MSDITFDTLQYARKLKEAGVPDQQAEIQAEALREIIEDKLATKIDLKQLENELRKEIENVKKEIKSVEERLSYKLTIRFGSMLVAAVLVLAAIIKL